MAQAQVNPGVLAMISEEAANELCPRVGSYGVLGHQLLRREPQGIVKVAMFGNHELAVRVAAVMMGHTGLAAAADRLVRAVELQGVSAVTESPVAEVRMRLREVHDGGL